MAGNWSDGAAPHSDADYLVAALGSPKLWTPTSGDAIFGGRSLAVGRVGGLAGYVRNIGWGNTLTIASLTLNNGYWRVAAGADYATGVTLAGAATVAAPDTTPFIMSADASEGSGTRAFTLASTLTGASGTALRFEADSAAVFDVTLPGDASAYAGSLAANGSNVVLRLTDSALLAPSGAGALTFSDGAALSPTGDVQRLSGSARVLASDGTGAISVPEGDSFTLAANLSGIFHKTGAGTLVLDGTTGSGTIVVDAGVVEATPAYASRIGSVTGGSVLIRLPTGSLDSNDTTALLTVPDTLPAGSVAINSDAVAPGWGATIRLEGGSAYVDVEVLDIVTMGADSFEAYDVGATAAFLPGWTGSGAVASGTPTTGDPPGVPLPDETHTKVLALSGEATRSYAGAFVRDNQSLDFLVQVNIADDADWREQITPDPTAQLRISFDERGHLWVLHGNASGTGYVWSQLGRELPEGLGRAEHDSYPDGGWIRVSVDIDYTTAAPAAYAQIRLEGRLMLAADGSTAPGAAANGGSWLRLPDATASAGKVSSITFEETQSVDDLVHRYHDAASAPDFAVGEGTELDGIPRSWFDAYGIPLDPLDDSDNDGFTNRREYITGTDPSDPESHPPAATLIILR